MKIIYRYLVKELVMPILFGIAAFTGIFIGTDLLFRLINYYNQLDVQIMTLIQLFFLNIPAIIVITFPMATLLGTLLAFSRLSGDGEITAMRTGGISIYKLIIPALIIALIMTFVTIFVNEVVVPRANYMDEQIVYELRHGKTLPSTQYNLFLPHLKNNKPDFFLFASMVDGDKGLMEGVIYERYKNGKPSTIIEAKKARWDGDIWRFFQGNIYYLQAGERVPAMEFKEFKVKDLIYTPRHISKGRKSIEEMNLKELKEYIDLLEKQGRNTNKEWIKFHQRFAIPFASFIFALVAAPLGLHSRRSGGSATGMGISIIIIFIYYTIMTIGSALGERGTISPFLGAWLQNIIFFIVGCVMIVRAGK